MSEQRNDRQQGKSPTLGQVIKSVLGAAFGVQSEEARQRDFSHGKPAVFIVAGLIFTIAFVIAIIVVVNVILSAAGAK